MTPDEWYLDQPVRLPNQQRGRVERLTKTLVVLKRKGLIKFNRRDSSGWVAAG